MKENVGEECSHDLLELRVLEDEIIVGYIVASTLC